MGVWLVQPPALTIGAEGAGGGGVSVLKAPQEKQFVQSLNEEAWGFGNWAGQLP